MKKAIYTFGIRMYGGFLGFASIFNSKARDWVKGRKNWKSQIRSQLPDNPKRIWFHCASLGEFEQGRPLIEAISEAYPDYSIILSFFSPSGFNIRKNYNKADLVCYLPLDIPTHSKTFLDILQPSLVVFVKYDIWINLLTEIGRRKIPAILISALMGKESRFLAGPMEALYREAFQSFDRIFTQNEQTRNLLNGFTNREIAEVAGDTRFDRVLHLPTDTHPLPAIEGFVGNSFCLVAGSTWTTDEEVLLKAWRNLRALEGKWIIAPHEIKQDRLRGYIEDFGDEMVLFSELEKANANTRILWIDNIGMLNRLYRFSDLAYVGGGFGSTVHNTQEPAVYGNPIAFGPAFRKFRECREMVKLGTAKSIANPDGFTEWYRSYYDNRSLLAEHRKKNQAYIQSEAGATAKIMEWLDKGFFNQAGDSSAF